MTARRACSAITGSSPWGADPKAALKLAAEVEALALQYSAALLIGDVKLLDDAQMREVVDKFRTTYGRQDVPDRGCPLAVQTLPI